MSKKFIRVKHCILIDIFKRRYICCQIVRSGKYAIAFVYLNLDLTDHGSLIYHLSHPLLQFHKSGFLGPIYDKKEDWHDMHDVIVIYDVYDNLTYVIKLQLYILYI